MSRPPKEDAVKTLIALLELEESVVFESDNILSVAVQASQLKQQEEHKEKKFKVSSSGDFVKVKRLK